MLAPVRLYSDQQQRHVFQVRLALASYSRWHAVRTVCLSPIRTFRRADILTTYVALNGHCHQYQQLTSTLLLQVVSLFDKEDQQYGNLSVVRLEGLSVRLIFVSSLGLPRSETVSQIQKASWPLRSRQPGTRCGLPTRKFGPSVTT